MTKKLDLLFLFLALVFVTLANVSHTVALRNVLLLLFLVYAGCNRHVLLGFIRGSGAVFWALAAFVGYAFLHSLLWSGWRDVSLSEASSQLLMGLLWFVVGGALFWRRQALSIKDVVMLAGALLCGVELGHALYQRITTGSLPYQEVFTTATKLELTFFINTVLVFLAVRIFADFSARFHYASRLPRWFPYLALLLLLLVSLMAGARNGLIGMVYLAFSMLGVFLYWERKRLGWKKTVLIIAAICAAIGGMASYAYHKDTRNLIFIGSADMGWHYQTSKGWLRVEDYPKMASGQMVDPSAYERVAWISRGLDLIRDNPLGYGYGRNAFTRSLTHIGVENKVGHSHSGFIDLGVGLGIPGILLWLLFCLSLMFTGLRRFVREQNTTGLVLALVVGGFVGRMLIESIQRDHLLHLFLFIVGALLAELLSRESRHA
ncbi:O-antigen ligase [Vogesella sp. LIG4]|uniref:O-antigen ligase family protein n=1 Tax=Vogesella sp. LIG4 TaxID=1192162 RepID=UPI00081FBCDA|nr:O-antigen ligase family protein [Vogesella sp. LIG4]SCK15099.1 O-Antigen ligase [Vogesella sp. LIG4]